MKGSQCYRHTFPAKAGNIPAVLIPIRQSARVFTILTRGELYTLSVIFDFFKIWWSWPLPGGGGGQSRDDKSPLDFSRGPVDKVSIKVPDFDKWIYLYLQL